MNLLGNPTLSPPSACPYIEGEEFTQEYFFANNLSKHELDIILQNGWRKFGIYFFRPKCVNCSKCTPLRVLVQEFSLNKKQRKIISKNSDIIVTKAPLEFREEYYDIYQLHSKRFNSAEDIESKLNFREGFFTQSCNSFVHTYKLENKIIAWGILDESEQGLSTVYFAFDPAFSKRSLGHFSALIELEYAKARNLNYYYLGYYIETNPSMSYKGSYHPHQRYNWSSKKWVGP